MSLVYHEAARLRDLKSTVKRYAGRGAPQGALWVKSGYENSAPG